MTMAGTGMDAAAIALAACRVAGVCVFAPVLASRVVPRRIALGLGVLLALAALPGIMGSQPVAVAPTVAAWVAGAAGEFTTGAVIGFIALLPLAAVRTAGALAGVQMGVGFGALYDGGAGNEGAQDGVERLMGFAALAMFVGAGGLDSLALGVLRSFEYVPLAAWPDVAGLPVLLGRGLMACSELTVRVALPVTVVLVAEVLVTGMLSRTVPSLGPVQFGFPVRVAVGLVALAAGAAATQDALHGATADALGAAHDWVVGSAS